MNLGQVTKVDLYEIAEDQFYNIMTKADWKGKSNHIPRTLLCSFSRAYMVN